MFILTGRLLDTCMLHHSDVGLSGHAALDHSSLLPFSDTETQRDPPPSPLLPPLLSMVDKHHALCGGVLVFCIPLRLASVFIAVLSHPDPVGDA